jgi:hypothetical protein
MPEKKCSKCGSTGPFVTISDGRRCQACGHVEPEAAPRPYTQPPDPPRPLPRADRISPRNPLGM